MVEKVTAYKTEKGRLFGSYKKAKRDEEKDTILFACKKLSKIIPHNFVEDSLFTFQLYEKIISKKTVDPILDILYKIEEIVMNW